MSTPSKNGPWDLEKFRARPLIYGPGGGAEKGGGGLSQFSDLRVPQKKDMKLVNLARDL